MLILIYILIAVLLSVPLWAFFIPLFILAAASVLFRRRPTLRKVCVALGLVVVLLSLPFAVVQACFQSDPDGRLASGFDVDAEHACVARYRFKPAGPGDTLEFWQLRRDNADVGRQIIHRNGLKMKSSDRFFRPGSVGYGPWWWPRSTQAYSVFEGEDGGGGSVEVWISHDGSRVYLHRFLE